MGLRERNAARTREHILDTAVRLFVDQGYESTTMEEVAQHADISTSTLYRYFPTKEQLISDPLALRGQMAHELAGRPADEPLGVALGHALAALVATPRLDPERLRLLFTVLEHAPGPRARLREDFVHERILLEEAIAARLGLPSDDVFCRMTARMATSVVELLGEHPTAPVPTTTPATSPAHAEPAGDQDTATLALAALRDLLAVLHAEPPVLPRLP